MDIRFEILEAGSLTPKIHEALLALLRELSPHMLLPDLPRLVFLARTHDIFVARSGDLIVGTAMLVTIPKYCGDAGLVDYVVVSESCRGRGAGRALMKAVISGAHKKGLVRLDLTSRPERTAAHHLYESLGFVKRETDVYRLLLRSN